MANSLNVQLAEDTRIDPSKGFVEPAQRAPNFFLKNAETFLEFGKDIYQDHQKRELLGDKDLAEDVTESDFNQEQATATDGLASNLTELVAAYRSGQISSNQAQARASLLTRRAIVDNPFFAEELRSSAATFLGGLGGGGIFQPSVLETEVQKLRSEQQAQEVLLSEDFRRLGFGDQAPQMAQKYLVGKRVQKAKQDFNDTLAKDQAIRLEDIKSESVITSNEDITDLWGLADSLAADNPITSTFTGDQVAQLTREVELRRQQALLRAETLIGSVSVDQPNLVSREQRDSFLNSVSAPYDRFLQYVKDPASNMLGMLKENSETKAQLFLQRLLPLVPELGLVKDITLDDVSFLMNKELLINRARKIPSLRDKDPDEVMGIVQGAISDIYSTETRHPTTGGVIVPTESEQGIPDATAELGHRIISSAESSTHLKKAVSNMYRRFSDSSPKVLRAYDNKEAELAVSKNPGMKDDAMHVWNVNRIQALDILASEGVRLQVTNEPVRKPWAMSLGEAQAAGTLGLAGGVLGLGQASRQGTTEIRLVDEKGRPYTGDASGVLYDLDKFAKRYGNTLGISNWREELINELNTFYSGGGEPATPVQEQAAPVEQEQVLPEEQVPEFPEREGGSTAIQEESNLDVNLIKDFEGFSATPYQDGQFLSVGYGHNGPEVQEGQEITKEEAEKLLEKDLRTARQAVDELVQVPLTPKQKAALVSLVYNVGVGAFKKSKALKELNKGNILNFLEEAFDDEQGFVMFEGKVNRGLVNRRKKERKVFLEGVNNLA